MPMQSAKEPYFVHRVCHSPWGFKGFCTECFESNEGGGSLVVGCEHIVRQGQPSGFADDVEPPLGKFVI